MTLYWWNHWFWITVVSVLATLPFTSVATYPISSPSLEQIENIKPNSNNNLKLPLEFPVPAQTDVDDIHSGGSENIPRTLLIKEQIIEKINNGKEEIPSPSLLISSSLSSLAAVSGQEKTKIENQLSDRSVKDVDQSIENTKPLNDDNEKNLMRTDRSSINSSSSSKNNITNSNNNSNNDNNNNSSNPNSSKSVIQLIPKAINQNKKESDNDNGMLSSPMSSVLQQNLKKQTESLDVVSFDNNSNNTNNSNVSNISTNISLGEKSDEQLKINVATTASSLISTSTGTTTTGSEEYKKAVSNIMQVTKSSSKIKSKTSISGSSSSSSDATVHEHAFSSNLDETTTGSDSIAMTTILHPVENTSDGNENSSEGFDSELIHGRSSASSFNKSDEGMTGGKIAVTLENVTKLSDKSLSKETERFRKSKGLSSEYRDAFINNYSSDAKSLLTRSAGQEEDFNDRNRMDDSGGNVSSEALQRAYVMDAGTISGICLSVLAVCCGVGTVGIVLYRRRFLNKPQALSEPDSSVYIDDSTIRDNSDEMYSLDNDSFLNSLEAMTIQNYWTDTVKHTKL